MVTAIIYSAPQVLQLVQKFLPRVLMSANMHGGAGGIGNNTGVLRSHEQYMASLLTDIFNSETLQNRGIGDYRDICSVIAASQSP